MKNKKGFTLVELLSIITVLGILVMLVVPQIGNNNKATKEKEYNKIKEVIESAAKVYHSSNDEVYLIDIETLIEERYLTTDLTNPINEEKIGGCVRVLKTTDGVFKYKYSESCGNINVAFHADLNHGSTTQQFQTSYIDGTILTLADPTRSEYSFSHWEVVRGNSYIVDDKLIIGDEDTEIYAMWRSWPTLTVDYDGGTPAETLNQKYMSGEIIDLKDPTKEGYTFTGWTIVSGNGILSVNGLTMGSEDTTIKANWRKNTYIINYVLNDGNSGLNSPTDASYNTIITIDNPKKEGYEFAGWTISGYDSTARHGTSESAVTSTIDSSSTMIKSTYFKDLKYSGGEVTLNANWTIVTYAISYELNGGTLSANKPTSATFNNIVTIDNPTKAGYEFAGWTISGYDSTARHGTSESAATNTISVNNIYSMYFKNLKITNGTVNFVANWKVSNPLNSYYCSNTSSGSAPYSIYFTNKCDMSEDSDGNWKIKFLESGTLTYNVNLPFDIFVVGGGGGGSSGNTNGGAGGGGGFTKTYLKQTIDSGQYEIVVGSGGGVGSAGGTSYFKDNNTYVAAGGNAGSGTTGGSGGSNGGNAGNGCYLWGGRALVGYDGEAGGSYGNGGQGTTTCEFDLGTVSGCNSDVTAYSGGGGGNPGSCDGGSTGAIGAGGAGGGGAGSTAGTDNTGGGGGGNAKGGSGVIIMKGRKEKDIIVNGTIIGTYVGDFVVDDEGNDNWNVKFLSSGTLNLGSSTAVDLFLVGGGGGGSAGITNGGAGGGGGYTATYLSQTLSAGEYDIVVGMGGPIGGNGETTYFKDSNTYVAAGGNAGSGTTGGSGGSNGGNAGNGCYLWGGRALVGFDGTAGSSYGNSGQGTTTCEFGEGTTSECTKGDAYAYSGGGGGNPGTCEGGSTGAIASGGIRGGGSGNVAGTNNTGGGGGGNAVGGSGIVVIRNAR